MKDGEEYTDVLMRRNKNTRNHNGKPPLSGANPLLLDPSVNKFNNL